MYIHLFIYIFSYFFLSDFFFNQVRARDEKIKKEYEKKQNLEELEIIKNATFRPYLVSYNNSNNINDNNSNYSNSNYDNNDNDNINNSNNINHINNGNNNNNNNINHNKINNDDNIKKRYNTREEFFMNLHSEKLSSRRFKNLERSIESERSKEHSFTPKINDNSNQLSFRKRSQRGNYDFIEKINRNNDIEYNCNFDNCNNKNNKNENEKRLNCSQVNFFSFISICLILFCIFSFFLIFINSHYFEFLFKFLILSKFLSVLVLINLFVILFVFIFTSEQQKFLYL